MISVLKKKNGKKAVVKRDFRLLSESALILIASGKVSGKELREACADLLAERGLDKNGEYTAA